MPPPAAPTKEQIGAALQTAGQYAGGSTVWTPQNAEELGLDPARGYVARGTPTDVPMPSPTPPPVEKPPPSMAPGLGTTGGGPSPVRQEGPLPPAPPQQSQQPGPESDLKGAISEEEHAKEEKKGKAATSQLEGAVSEEEHAKEGKSPPQLEGAVSEEEHAKEAAAPPPDQQPSQPETPMPSGTGAGAPQGISAPLVPGRDAHVNALIASGKTPGEAQAIADGQQPKTLTGQTPQPKPKQPPDIGTLAGEQAYVTGAPVSGIEQQPAEATKPTTTQQQPPKPIDTLKADEQNRVDPVALYSYLLGKFANSGLVGYVPPDGARWGIKTGSAAEWAAFGLAVAKQESDLNTRSYNASDPGGSAGLFQFGQGQTQFTKGGDQFDPQQSADTFVRAVQHYLANKGSIANLGETFGSIKRPDEAGQYITGAQKVAAGGSGKDLVSSGGGGGSKDLATGPGGPAGPWISVGGASSGGGAAPAQFRGPPEGGGGGAQPDYSPSESRAEPISLAGLGGLLAGGVAAGSLFRGGGGQPRAQRPAEEEPQPLLGGMKPANVLGVRTVGTQAPPAPAPESLGAKLLQLPTQPALPPSPPAAPSLAPLGLDPAVVKGLMKRGFTRQQAEAFAAKATVSKPGGAAITGGAGFRPPPAAPQAPAAPAPPAKQAAAAPPAKQAAPQPQPREATRIGPRGSTVGVAKPPGAEAITQYPRLTQQAEQHAAILSPDDPRVKKQRDNMIKGEHFVPGDPLHEQLLNGLPNGHGGRQRQILGQAEQAISDKTPLHLSYISAPREAQKFPTRESRTVQYEAHSPEARLMGTTEGQLVGHSMIPVSVGISPSRKAGEPHQGYIQGISTNVMANNFQHILTKLAAMDRKVPYTKMGQKFSNDLEGYLANLNAGHTGTGRGYAVGTEQYPTTPDESHVPYKLTRGEADFLNLVINNTGAFAKHEDGQALRELARANGTLINERGETNRLRHQIEQHEPGWRERVLEPTIRSFKAGLIHEIHPTEEHMPESIRPGKEYHSLTKATARTSQRGRPDVPVAVSLHHTFTDNKRINQIERDFSDERINEAEARSRLKALGEDPDEYQFVGGSGGLITPYEENPEAITPEEHTELKTNLRKQWIGGKMPIEDYRRKAAEVPLPEKPSQPPAASPTVPEAETVPSPKPITPVKPKPPKPQPEPESEPVEAEETPETPPSAPKPAAPVPKAKPVPKAPQEVPEAFRGPPAPDEPLPAKKAAAPIHTFKKVKPEEFIAQRNKSSRAGFLSELKPEDIKDHKLFTNHEGTVGAAVSPEGDIQNVFNNGGPKGHAAHAIGHAIEQHGGKTLDAYDGFLPDYYRQFGFHETGRMKFNPAFAHNWDTAKQGTPDVVFMAHKGYPEGGHAAAVERTASKDKTKWIPNEQSSRYDDDWDAQKARSRNEAVAGGEKDYRTAGVEQGPKTQPAGGAFEPGAGAAPGGTLGPPPAPSGAAKKGTKEPPPRPISAATQKVLGPQPKNKKQAKLWQQAGERLDTQVPEGIPLEVDRGDRGKFKTDPKGKVLYKKVGYDIANAPLLQKQGKALGQELNKKTGKMGIAKPPAETEDDLASLDPEKRLTPFLNPTDRKRVAHLNDISAVEAYADELHKMYKGIEDLPEVMKGKNWYDEAVNLLRQHFGSHADFMANLLGATSAGNAVKTNFKMALDAYHQFLRGHYDEAIKLYNQAYDIKQSGKGALMKHITDNGIHEALGEEAPETDERAMEQWITHHNLTPRASNGKLFGHNSIQVLKVLAHNWEEQAGGPKTPNFAANLNGRSMQATIDMWAARTMRRLGFEGHTSEPWMIQPAGETGVHNVDFGLSQLAFKKAADKIGIKPSALQAILWFAEQKEWQKRGWEREQDPDERDYRPMLKKYQRPADITEAQGAKFHPSVPELEARLKGAGGGVLHMQGGGLVDDPDPDPSPLDQYLKGVLAGHGNDFEAIGAKYGVDPVLLASVATFESDHGKSPAAKKYNSVMGEMDPSNPGQHQKFDSVEDSIDKGASNLSRNYLQKGLTTIPQIGAVYSPVRPSGQRVSNDLRGTNQEWPGTVQKLYTQMGGTNTFFGPQTVGVGVNMMGGYPQPPPPSPNWSPSPGEAPPPNAPPPVA